MHHAHQNSGPLLSASFVSLSRVQPRLLIGHQAQTPLDAPSCSLLQQSGCGLANDPFACTIGQTIHYLSSFGRLSLASIRTVVCCRFASTRSGAWDCGEHRTLDLDALRERKIRNAGPIIMAGGRGRSFPHMVQCCTWCWPLPLADQSIDKSNWQATMYSYVQ